MSAFAVRGLVLLFLIFLSPSNCSAFSIFVLVLVVMPIYCNDGNSSVVKACLFVSKLAGLPDIEVLPARLFFLPFVTPDF